MHRVRVFLNGAASSSRAQDWEGQIRRGLFRSAVEFVAATSYEAFQKELRRAAEEKVDVVISVGGDGTFNTLLQELASSDTTFLVVPAGTANDLARELGITKKLKKAIECIRKNEAERIDLLSVNGRYMATNGGIGLVSDVALNINEWRNRVPGFRKVMTALHHHVYSMALVGHLATWRHRYYQVAVDSKEFSGEIETPLLLINNQPYLGGSFPVAPLTSNTDGRFNVTIFTHKKWSQLVTAIWRVKENLPIDHDPNAICFETEHIEIQSLRPDQELVFFGDGELLARSRRLEIAIHKKALRVFRPIKPCFQPADDGLDAVTDAGAFLGEPSTI